MGFYEFGNWNRILKGMYALSHFSSVSEKVLTLQDISTNKKFLKSVEVSQSTGGGGGGGACEMSWHDQVSKQKILLFQNIYFVYLNMSESFILL